jgi:hypothetical protein
MHRQQVSANVGFKADLQCHGSEQQYVRLSSGGRLRDLGRHAHHRVGMGPLTFQTANKMLIALTLMACGSESVSIPTSSGACTVRAGDARTVVRQRCSDPCRNGSVAKGICAHASDRLSCAPDIAFCSNDCDIYSSYAICYDGAVVVLVAALPARGINASPCTW